MLPHMEPQCVGHSLASGKAVFRLIALILSLLMAQPGVGREAYLRAVGRWLHILLATCKLSFTFDYSFNSYLLNSY